MEIDINDIPENREVQVGINLDNNPGCMGIKFWLRKDSNLVCEEYSPYELGDHNCRIGHGFFDNGNVIQIMFVPNINMDEGELCYLKYRDEEEHVNEYRTYPGKADVKLVILINENSASSSEILTGALRDCADAVTVGVKSFGKGIIQGVYSVGNAGAGYQMTIAQYFTPNGTAVHKIGLEPDYEVPLPDGDNGMYEFADMEKDVQLIKAVEVMKELLK